MWEVIQSEQVGRWARKGRLWPGKTLAQSQDSVLFLILSVFSAQELTWFVLGFLYFLFKKLLMLL